MFYITRHQTKVVIKLQSSEKMCVEGKPVRTGREVFVFFREAYSWADQFLRVG
jgi:hypothetical protein